MKSFKVILTLLFFTVAFTDEIKAQTIPSSSNGTTRCGNCVPSGWTILNATPDISDRDIAAATGPMGLGAPWVQTVNGTTSFQLPLPPTGHTTWVSMRDIGIESGEESTATQITGLVSGREYQITFYSLTAVSTVGGSSRRYADRYNDRFSFRIGGATATKVIVPSITQNVWGATSHRFTANASSMELAFFPGFNANAIFLEYECVNVSIASNSINTIPVAENKSVTGGRGIPVTIDAIENAIEYDAGQIVVPGSVDLNPSTAGIDQSITTAQGTWSVNSSGIVTFTPAAGFVGTATIPYTVRDNYSILFP